MKNPTNTPPEFADNEKLLALQARVDELSDFIENASLPLHWVDKNVFITWANQAELDALGFTREEYIGASITNFHQDPEVISDILTRLSNNETLHNYPAKLKCKDGSIKHVLISSNVARKDGQFIRTRCFTRDVTQLVNEMERKESLLQELKESDTRMKMAISSTNMGTWEYSPSQSYLYLSPEAIIILGFPEDQTVDYNNFLSIVDPQQRTRVEHGLAASVKATGNDVHSTKFKIIRPGDQAERWLHLQGKITLKSNQKTIRFIGTVLDITEAVLAEEKNSRLLAIIDSSNDAIISFNLEGKITSWNNAAEDIFGFQQEEVIGSTAYALIPDTQHQELTDLLTKVARGERVHQLETRLLSKDHTEIEVAITLSPIKEATGKIIGFSKIVRDITEKKHEEQRKNSFIAMVSHEIKTPITAVTAYLQILLQKAQKEQNSFFISMLSRADLKVKKMTAMVQDFLNVTRLEEGKFQILKQEFELAPLVKEVADDEQFISNQHIINIVNCEELKVYADKEKLGHVLTNLLNNAIKYSPKGGNIFIECATIGKKVRISITDHGIGIKKSDQKKIFERFYRVDDENEYTASGFGIGLYLASEILSYHNSQIHIQSKEGKGATFFFDLEISSKT
ncbi:PAS domain S-box protein [Pedobacter gandavensis]|uniref:PAS domain-containing sensor histidine kinase n=1 Tax=Pedobacter gandavensis TaxID=2679963 RepID=UPI0024783CE8|nr:PAS domain S-box protein [Pedobacter gandavensis]WGQ10610.1 PAS domain S-box protein [Pedobacter gandavensis]